VTTARPSGAAHVLRGILAAFALAAGASIRGAEAKPVSASGASRSWLGIDAGVGRVSLDQPAGSSDSTDFYLAIAGGVKVTPQFLLGLSAAGWLQESGNLNDPSRGLTVSTCAITSRLYPSSQARWHLRASGGYAAVINNHPNAVRRKSGTSYDIGFGWDRPMGSDRMSWTPLLLYSGGTLGDTRMSALTLAIGFSWR
jgi:hypothetical protein